MIWRDPKSSGKAGLGSCASQIRLLAIVAILLLTGTARADENSDANKLAVKARRLYEVAAVQTDPWRRIEALEEVVDNLRRIVSDYPGSDLAVRILDGEEAAGVLLEDAERLLRETQSQLTALRSQIIQIIDRCVVSITSECLFDGAVTFVVKNPSADARAELLTLVASSLAEAGYIAQAVRLLDGMENKARRAARLAQMAVTQARDGSTERARELIAIATTAINEATTVKDIVEPDVYSLSGAATEVAKANAYVGDQASAVTMALAAKSERGRAMILLDVASVFVGAGNFTAATRVLDQVSDQVKHLDEDDRLDALEKIADIQAKGAKVELAKQSFETAVTIARAIADPSRRDGALSVLTKAQAEIGLYDEALGTAQLIGRNAKQQEARADVVQAQARAGHLNEALVNVALIDPSYVRADALAEIARAYVAIGNTEKALETVQGLAGELGLDRYPFGGALIESERVEVMADVAAVFDARGDHFRAKRLFADAVELVSGLDPSAGRNLSAEHVAELQARGGRVDDGILTAGLAEEDFQSVILRNIVTGQLAIDELAQAERAALIIEDAHDRAIALIEIAGFYVKAKNRDGAAESLVRALTSAKDVDDTTKQLEVLLLAARTLRSLE